MIPLEVQLSQWACGLQGKPLPAAAAHEVKRRLIDTLGCALGAFDAEPARIARALAAAQQSSTPASLAGTGLASTPEMAAFANGVMFRYLDYNDTYLSLEPAHPSDNFAAALAAAECAGAGGMELMRAAAAAYEVQCRLCDAVSIRARGWDHVTFGSFSASIAAGMLLQLTAEQMTHAQAIAAIAHNAMRQTRAGALSHWKGCAFANASRQAVFAAELAKLGMTGPSDIFAGEMGFQAQVSGPFDLNISAFGGPDKPFMIEQTYIKRYPAEYHSQSAIEAALALRTKIGSPSEIERVEIDTFRAAVEIIGDPEKWRPSTRETADHSLPYCTAAALLEGDLTLASFDAAHLANTDLLDLTARTSVREHPPFTALYPEGIPNRVTVYLRNGEVLQNEVVYPPGHARNPLTDAQVEAKFRTLAEPHLTQAAINRLLQRIWNLEEESSITSLLAEMRVQNQ